MSHIAFEQGQGVLRLAPTWVPRSFCTPGRRLKLHPDDYYAFGAHRGGIDERWFTSTTRADNGPLTTPDEGLSYVLYATRSSPGGLLGDLIRCWALGQWAQRCGAPPCLAMYAKFFDNQGRCLTHHQLPGMRRVWAPVKPGVFLPAAAQQPRRAFSYTFFGLQPGTTREQVRHCLEIWDRGETITDSRAPIASSPAPVGMCPRACCTRRAACAPMSRSGPAMSLRCSSRW